MEHNNKFILIDEFFEQKLPSLQKNPLKDKTLVFIGAGLSRNYGCTGWDELATSVIKACFDNGDMNYLTYQGILRNVGNYKTRLTIGKRYLYQKKKNKVFKQCLKKSLNDSKSKVAKSKSGVYNYLKNIFRFFITTNADRHINNFFDGEKIYFLDMPSNGIERDTLYKIHGCISNMESMVFTTDEYLNKYMVAENGKEVKLGNFLQKIFQEYHVIFIGYGLSEFELLERMIGESKNEHYIINGYYEHETGLIEAQDLYFNAFNVKQVVYYLDKNGHTQLTEQIEQYYNKKQSENHKPLEIFTQIDEIMGKNIVVCNKAEMDEVIKIISLSQEYKDYFFTNLKNMKSPEKWFSVLNTAGLLSPENNIAIVYIKLLFSYSMHNNKEFITLVEKWIDSFAQPESLIINAIWFIEEAIKFDKFQNKCKSFILGQLANTKFSYQIISSIGYNNKIDEFMVQNSAFVLEIIEILTDPKIFTVISQDVHGILTVREKLSEYLINAENSNFSTIIVKRVLFYLKIKPIVYDMVDTIDTIGSGYNYPCEYGKFIIGFLIKIINSNLTEKNEDLIANFYQIVEDNPITNFEKFFIFKIIIFIIYKIGKFQLIARMFQHIKSLEELSSIKYALYHCIITKSTNMWYNIFPNFEDWLSELDYSEDFKNSCSEKKMLELRAKDIKLTLLYSFKSTSLLYKRLIHDYPYQVGEPRKCIEIKSSRESKNHYMDILKAAPIEQIIEYLNGKKLTVKSDFPELHLKEAFEQDFRLNKEKYLKNIILFFNDLNFDVHKSWVLSAISSSLREETSDYYRLILTEVMAKRDIDKQYFYSILSFLCAFVNKNVQELLVDELSIRKFLINNIVDKEDAENIDNLGGGRNSLSGQCLYILIQISFAKDNTLSEFANSINEYHDFLQNSNGLLVLGQYLFWLYTHKAFLQYFNQLDKSKQNIILSGYFKYSNYINEKIFELSISNNFINSEENIHPYINHAMYLYLTNKNDYLFNLLNSKLLDEKFLGAVVLSLETYNCNITDLNAKDKLLRFWEVILKSRFKNKLASRLLDNSDFIDISNSVELELFCDTFKLLSLNLAVYKDAAFRKLSELLDKKGAAIILDLLIISVDNSQDIYYLNEKHLDQILKRLKESLKLNDNNCKQFHLLLSKLKKINYTIPREVLAE